VYSPAAPIAIGAKVNFSGGVPMINSMLSRRPTSKAAAQIVLHRDVGDKKNLTAVLEVSDQRGSKQRVKFRGLEQT
jgi:hypothetical protein